MAFEKNKGDNSNSKHVNLNEGSKFVPKTISELNSYLRSYENELKKVDAFKRELPLCMQFLKTEIEKLKEEEDDMSIEHSEKRTWMSSFQLWSTHVEYQQQQGYFSPSMCDEDDEAKPVDDEGTISGGLFGRPPQKKIKKKLRRCWSPELHRVFVHALDEIGGAEGLDIQAQAKPTESCATSPRSNRARKDSEKHKRSQVQDNHRWELIRASYRFPSMHFQRARGRRNRWGKATDPHRFPSMRFQRARGRRNRWGKATDPHRFPSMRFQRVRGRRNRWGKPTDPHRWKTGNPFCDPREPEPNHPKTRFSALFSPKFDPSL
ncbi:hypothetical protein CASFOL_029354 [Castilleja foliolosa]|uniref:HHO5-like N-terminal domain-containing protein n=1 Tax=Castilleja foliolosa TaxID=1961234 RepID=A0ABD3CB29_9LAMI